MYLKRMELHGFKSFPNKTELVFSPGITSIVGPNGSGKSNIADAIRWTLGEQSAKTLRGSKMEDVIFSGSDTRKPLGFAEVTLVFDNSDHYLPIDFLEVQITRRVYRSGGSEFLISGVPCLLRDIHTLFMDTGLGKSGYSVIEQGKIDAILAAGSGCRRAFFEEAAGINRYKARRNEADRRLQAAKRDRDRIRDLITELKMQLEPLAKRADEARKFQEYNHRLSILEINFILVELEKLNRINTDLQDKLDLVEARINKVEKDRDRLGDQILIEKASRTQLDDERDEIYSHIAILGDKIEKTEGNIGVTSERIANLESQLASLEAAYKKDMVILTDIKSELKHECSRLIAVNDDLKHANEELKIWESEEERLATDLKAEKDREDCLKVDIIEVLSELAEVKNKLTGKQMADEAKKRQFERNKQQLKDAEQEFGDISNQLKRDEELLSEFNRRREVLTQKLSRAEENLESSRNELENLYETLRELERQANAKSLELDAYRQRSTGSGWYPEGTRAVITAADHGKLRGIIGIIADIIKVPDNYENAIEVALGRSLYDIVVERETDAKDGIAYLKEYRLGTATFLPLDLIQAFGFPKRYKHTLSIPGVCGIASKLVSCDESVCKAVDFSLGRVVVVDNLDVAVKVALASGKSLKIVTVDGDIIFPGGAITGGSNIVKPGGQLLKVKRRLANLEIEEKNLNAEALRVTKQIKKIKDVIYGLEELCSKLNMESREIEFEVTKLGVLQAERRKDLGKIRLLTDMLQSEFDAKEAEEVSGDKTKQYLKEKYSELTLASDRLSKTQEEISQRLRSLSLAREEAMHKITAAKVKIASRAQEGENLKTRISSMEKSLSTMISEINLTEQKIKEIKNSIPETYKLLDKDKAYLDALRKDRLKLEERLILLKKSGHEVTDCISEKEKALEALRVKSEKLGKNMSALHLREVETTEGIRYMKDRLMQIYGMTPEEAEQAIDPDQHKAISQKNNIKEEIRMLREEMVSMGPIDPGAIEVYEAMKLRQEFLTEGSDDIKNAMDCLENLIEYYDKRSEKQFRETLKKVGQEFNTLFSKLFGGGTADLVLVDSETDEPPGVEIVAEPPGKRLQNLTLLSTGERALAAIALVFGILKVCPSPCCMLDEIDAALDGANVGRFAELLKDAAGEGQFIVITHRKGTMESADVLYGVTMEESGVSKLVSLDLDSADHQETA